MRWFDPKSGAVVPATQICRACKQAKQISEFPWRKAAHDRKEGPLSRCYECDRDYRRELKARKPRREFLPWMIYTPPVLAELRSHIEAGLTIEEIAEKMSLSVKSLANARSNHSLPPFFRKPRVRSESDLVPTIARMATQGASYAKIGRKIGKSRNAVSGIVFRNRQAFNLAVLTCR